MKLPNCNAHLVSFDFLSLVLCNQVNDELAVKTSKGPGFTFAQITTKHLILMAAYLLSVSLNCQLSSGLSARWKKTAATPISLESICGQKGLLYLGELSFEDPYKAFLVVSKVSYSINVHRHWVPVLINVLKALWCQRYYLQTD